MAIPSEIKKVKERGQMLRREIRERTVGYIAAALGLVAGLAWNDAIKSFIEYLFPLSNNTILAKFLYATLLTFVVVLITVQILRFMDHEKK